METTFFRTWRVHCPQNMVDLPSSVETLLLVYSQRRKASFSEKKSPRFVFSRWATLKRKDYLSRMSKQSSMAFKSSNCPERVYIFQYLLFSSLVKCCTGSDRADQLFHDNLNHFDFVCISLNSEPDRQMIFRNYFRISILDRVIHWWIVEKTSSKEECMVVFESHWLVWNALSLKAILFMRVWRWFTNASSII
jgi:hypothetical protein